MFNEVCQADTLRDRCKADNVKVTCYSDTRRRRSLSGESKGYVYCDFIVFPFLIMEGPKPLGKHLIIKFIAIAVLNNVGAFLLGFHR